MKASGSQMKKKTDITGLGGVLMDSATPRSVGAAAMKLRGSRAQYLYTLRKARPDLAVKIQQTLETEARPQKKVWRKQSRAETSADTNMVFILPSEFCAPKDEEVSVAQFDCGPRPVIFEKPRDRSYRHLKALYLKGYINGQPISKMLVDTGAAVNIMPYSMLRCLGRSNEDLIKTNVTLSDFNPSAKQRNAPQGTECGSPNTVHLSDLSLIIFILARHQLLVQGADFGQIGLQFSFEAFCFFMGAGNESFLILDELFGYPNPFFKILQLLSQDLQFSGTDRSVTFAPKYGPDFTKFSGSEGTSSIEHVSRYLAQLGMVSASDELRVRFSQSLTGPAFGWYTSLPPDSVRTWKQLEEQFHIQYHSEATKAGIADLTQVRETVSEYIQRFRTVKNRCYSVRLSEKEAVELAIAGLSAPLKDLTFQADYNSLAHMVQKLTSYEQRHRCAGQFQARRPCRDKKMKTLQKIRRSP
ncbi:hypothetical protein QYE76_052132 [Lolium multiflorum]|uniref:Retrotransposon gag domain-containing protein n=1 Tax=Lolium multiflorum TaxID=4521 RepID=A0AAD8ST71_LOLMU|nr:hypothetical protein QYE76_052132 [Lolium multiflorum]